VNCWEYKKCTEDVFSTCPAYPASGTGCWMLSGVKCQGRENSFTSLDEQIAYCGRCDFYAQGSSRNRLKPAGSTAGSKRGRRVRI
jgi:hypothetical protein